MAIDVRVFVSLRVYSIPLNAALNRVKCDATLEPIMRVLQSTPSIAAYKRALRAKLGLRGAALERAARVAAKYGNANAVLRAAAGF